MCAGYMAGYYCTVVVLITVCLRTAACVCCLCPPRAQKKALSRSGGGLGGGELKLARGRGERTGNTVYELRERNSQRLGRGPQPGFARVRCGAVVTVVWVSRTTLYGFSLYALPCTVHSLSRLCRLHACLYNTREGGSSHALNGSSRPV